MSFLSAARNKDGDIQADGYGKSLEMMLMLLSITNLVVEQVMDEKHIDQQSARQFVLESLADCWNAKR